MYQHKKDQRVINSYFERREWDRVEREGEEPPLIWARTQDESCTHVQQRAPTSLFPL